MEASISPHDARIRLMLEHSREFPSMHEDAPLFSLYLFPHSRHISLIPQAAQVILENARGFRGMRGSNFLARI
jgi:hypothetical protein